MVCKGRGVNHHHHITIIDHGIENSVQTNILHGIIIIVIIISVINIIHPHRCTYIVLLYVHIFRHYYIVAIVAIYCLPWTNHTRTTVPFCYSISFSRLSQEMSPLVQFSCQNMLLFLWKTCNYESTGRSQNYYMIQNDGSSSTIKVTNAVVKYNKEETTLLGANFSTKM